MKLRNKISQLMIGISLIIINACKQESKKENTTVKKNSESEIHFTPSKFPELKNLKKYNHTNFATTLESKFDPKSNTIYCATMLFAWDAVRNELPKPIKINSAYLELNWLNSSTSFKNVLAKDEYTVDVKVSGDTISAKAEFSRSLPFFQKLIDFPNNLKFKNEKVAAFGILPNYYELMQIFEILYYENDNEFAIKLYPKDSEHFIVLYKTKEEKSTLGEMVKNLEEKIKLSADDRKNIKLRWKYEMLDEDELVIPKISFNIEHDYTGLLGKSFIAGGEQTTITKAWQRNAFVLNENGAEIESEAEFAAAVEEAPPEDVELPKPKKMRFDGPFLVLLQKKNALNPYFALWIANTELLQKE